MYALNVSHVTSINFHFLFSKQPAREITALAEFLSEEISPELIDGIVHRTEFQKMKLGKYDSEAMIRQAYKNENASLFRKGLCTRKLRQCSETKAFMSLAYV